MKPSSKVFIFVRSLGIVPKEVLDRVYESILESVRRGEISKRLDNPIVEILSKPLIVVILLIHSI
ncbi:MAG: hypothetical protein ABDH32_05335 [Candidatus Caldarchaeales archaeon]